MLHRDLRPANVLVGENDMIKVADFGTSRFLEIAAHGTTVIGSPPYMAPEQFHGKAVFASDIYSLGVTMYQMLTGSLPYDTPAPADIGKLMSGELVSNPRLLNPSIPKSISDIILHAMAPDVTASLPARLRPPRGRAGGAHPRLVATDTVGDRPASIPGRDRPRRALAATTPRASRTACGTATRPAARFCWQCRKPLHARTDRCPFCGEGQ